MATVVVLVCLALLFGCSDGRSQDGFVDTKGKQFSLAFFPEYSFAPVTTLRNYLYLSSSSSGMCHISYHDNTRRTSKVTLVAGDIVEKGLPDTTQLKNEGTSVQSKAIHVNCSVEVAMYGLNKWGSGTDIAESFVVLPHNILSTSYLAASVEQAAFIGVVAVKSNTNLSVVLASTCDYRFNNQVYKSGDTINITLAYNDVLRVGGTTWSSTSTCDLGGTMIYSSDPVAVFSGSLYYYRGSSHIYGHLVHQVPSLYAFSQTVIVPRAITGQSNRMYVRAIASHDNTVLNITSESDHGVVRTQSYHLHSGQFINNEFDQGSNVVVQSDAPVMVIQRILCQSQMGGASVFIPGINEYGRTFRVKSFHLDGASTAFGMTLITSTTSTRDLRVNGVYPHGITWTKLTTLPYSIGSLSIHRNVPYNISSSSRLMVRVDDVHVQEFDSYIAGYQLPVQISDMKNATNLTCLPDSWFVTMDLSRLYLRPSDVSDIYLTKDSCTGIQQGDLLIFNNTYDECHTETRVSNGTLNYLNTLIYAPKSAENLVTDIKWFMDIKCSTILNGTDSVHIYPDYQNIKHPEASGVIKGSMVRVTLYKDASFLNPVPDSLIKAEIGNPVYVQVAASGSQNTVMVVRSCDAHLEVVKHVSYPLIVNGCSYSSRTEILITRNLVTRFKFVMFDLPKEENGLYVTCYVTFCDPMDFSAKCQQRCHTDPHVGIIG